MPSSLICLAAIVVAMTSSFRFTTNMSFTSFSVMPSTIVPAGESPIKRSLSSFASASRIGVRLTPSSVSYTHLYIWYDIKEKVYDNKIPVYFCFNPQKNLEFVNLYPQHFDLNAIQHWECWTPEEAQKDKRYCDEWLMRFVV